MGVRFPLLFLLLFLLPRAAGAWSSAAENCPPSAGVAVQVLGSGGPIADDGRASSADLVWLDGRSRLLVDAGGGSFLRFGEAGAAFADLDLIALSHFHTDHSADLPALLKSGYFSERERHLTVSGPTGAGAFPGLGAFLQGLLDPGSGAFAYLAGYLDGSDGLVALRPVEVSHRAPEPATVFDNGRLKVTARGVPHGIVPSLAYRVEADGVAVVFGSDQSGTDHGFVDFLRGADLFVAHFAVPESAGGAAVRLHARPSTLGDLARDAGVRSVLLSHFMARSLADLAGGADLVRDRFGGPVRLASDLGCHPVGRRP